MYTQVHMKKANNESENVIKFKEKVRNYLTTTPATVQTAEGVKECSKYLDKFNLTKAEKLQLINLVPNTDVDVHAIIEDCPERMSPEGIEELIYEINRMLIPPLPLSSSNSSVPTSEPLASSNSSIPTETPVPE